MTDSAAGQGGRRTRAKEDKRKRITGAARALFAERGVNGVTTQQIADRADVEELPHINAWREAYRSFGAKPQRTRNSVEALTRRAEAGLPRVNRLTDIYNALSVLHQVPIGGEDLARYDGSPRLICATGAEDFDTTAGGGPITEHPEAGEVVWTDQTSITCRRWNWRQGRRTALTDATTTALFLLDALDPMSDEALETAGAELIEHLRELGPAVRVATRVISAPWLTPVDGPRPLPEREGTAA